nr:MAG TPA: hypothetical protein [Caudoviricetes sp.]
MIAVAFEAKPQTKCYLFEWQSSLIMRGCTNNIICLVINNVSVFFLFFRTCRAA